MGGFAMTAGSRTWWASVDDLRTLAVDFRIHAMGKALGRESPSALISWGEWMITSGREG